MATDRAAAAVGHPGEHPWLDTRRPPARRESLIGVAVIAALTAVGLAFATRRVLGAAPDDGPIGPIDEIEIRLSGPGAGASWTPCSPTC